MVPGGIILLFLFLFHSLHFLCVNSTPNILYNNNTIYMHILVYNYHELLYNVIRQLPHTYHIILLERVFSGQCIHAFLNTLYCGWRMLYLFLRAEVTVLMAD